MAINEKSMPYLLADALRGYSQDFRLLSATNPYRFWLNGRTYSAHASEVHFAARHNADEWRIQLARYVRDEQKARQEKGDIILFIGFFPDEPVFSGWEASYVLSLNSDQVGSVYVPHSHAQVAMVRSAALDVKRANNLGRDTTKVTLRSEFLGVYAENLSAFHSSRTQIELANAVNQISDFVEKPITGGELRIDPILGGERRLVTSTRTAFARDPAFRDAVMHAYNGACCVCGRQLGLVQAAHIVPHSHPDCIQSVTNGLALCIEHHKLYDDALLLPTAGRQFRLNEGRVEHLVNIGQDSGLEEVRRLAAGQYRTPEHVPSRPDDGLLERGVRIRLGIDA